MSLYVEESGASGSQSIVFLHGVGTSSWMWWQQIPALADFHCLNVDLPGHGKSNHISWVSLTDTAHQIADIIQSRATYGRAHVVGLSLGGYVALKLLEHHADLMRRVVINGVTASPMPNRRLLKPQLLMMAIMKRRWIANMQAKALNLPKDAQLAFTENLQAMSMQTYQRIAEEVVVFTLPAALHDNEVPTLVTAGGNESYIILQAVHEIPQHMPHALGRIAPEQKHGWNVDAPDLFNAMIHTWCCDRPLPARLQALHHIGT